MTKREELYFLAGAAVGGMAAWWLTKYHYEHLVIEVEGSESYIPGNEDKTLPGPEEDVDNGYPERERTFTHYKAPDKNELEKLAIKYRSSYWDNPPELNAEDGWEEGDSEYPKEEPADHPYIIPEEEFSEGRLTYDKVTLFYHGGDNTLIEEGIPYEEFDQQLVEQSIGSDNVEALKLSEEGIIYVRNERLGIDYMIIMERDSYGKEILGLGADG